MYAHLQQLFSSSNELAFAAKWEKKIARCTVPEYLKQNLSRGWSSFKVRLWMKCVLIYCSFQKEEKLYNIVLHFHHPSSLVRLELKQPKLDEQHCVLPRHELLTNDGKPAHKNPRKKLTTTYKISSKHYMLKWKFVNENIY